MRKRLGFGVQMRREILLLEVEEKLL